MVYTGEYNADESKFVFNVTGKKVFDDMQAGKLTVLNLPSDTTTYSILLLTGNEAQDEGGTYYDFHMETVVATALHVDSIYGSETDNLTLYITNG